MERIINFFKIDPENIDEFQSIKNRTIFIICIAIPNVLLWTIFDYLVDPDNYIFFLKIRLLYAVFALLILASVFKFSQKKTIIYINLMHYFAFSASIITFSLYTSNYALYGIATSIGFVAVAIIMNWKPVYTVISSSLIYLASCLSSYYVYTYQNIQISDIAMVTLWNFTILVFASGFSFINYYYSNQILDLTLNLKEKVNQQTQELREKKEIVEDANAILEKRNLLLEDSVRKMKGLAGSIAHEMRNPLSIIKQNLLFERDFNALPDGNILLSSDSIDSFDSTINRAEYFISIILNNLRNQSISDKKNDIFNVIEIINKAVDTYPFELDEKNSVHLDLENGFEIKADRNILLFVLYNLLKNAVYYFRSSEDSRILIKLNKNENHNILIFEDNGPGIPKDILDQLFGNYTTFNKDGGTGLGLSFCHEAMTSFGGCIACESTLDEFTRFILSFPKI